MGRIKVRRKEVFQGFLCAAILVCLATGIGWLFRLLQFPETNIVVVYILSVILTARFTDVYIWGILATVLSTCAFNIFFTHPYYTLSVDDPTYFISGKELGKQSGISAGIHGNAAQETGAERGFAPVYSDPYRRRIPNGSG